MKNRLILPTFFLLFLCSFVFADVISSPFDFALPLGILALATIILIALITFGILIIYFLYLKLVKKKSLSIEDKSKFEKFFLKLIKYFFIAIFITLILTFLSIIIVFPHGGGQRDPIVVIPQTLRSIWPSGTSVSSSFIIQPKSSFHSTYIAVRLSYDINSFHFCISNNEQNQTLNNKLNITVEGRGDTITSTSTTDLILRARVICEITPEQVQERLNEINENCPTPNCGESEPCCIIIFERAP